MAPKDKRPNQDPTIKVCISLSRSELEKIDDRTAHHNVRSRSEYLVARALGRPLELRPEGEARMFAMRRNRPQSAELREDAGTNEATEAEDPAAAGY